MVEIIGNLGEFRKCINNKRCLCFGAGLMGLHMVYLMEDWGLSNRIIAFVDNNPDKWNTFFKVEQYSYPILSMNEAVKYVQDDVTVVITCADVVGMKEQMREYLQLENTECFSLTELAQGQLMISDYDSSDIISDVPIIPKRIHYCWFGGNMPEIMKKNVDGWKELCPDYEIFEWNDNNYDVKKNMYTYEAYKMKKWGFVPDYIRLDVIYRYGGIYMDTDVELLQRPDSLLCQKGFFIKDSTFFVNPGAGYGAAAGEELVRNLRDYYNNKHFILKDGKCDMTASQMHGYRVLRDYGVRVNDALQQIEGFNFYPMIMASTNVYSLQMRKSEKAYFAHYGTTTWMHDAHNEERKKIQGVMSGLTKYRI